jgi:RNA polymerase sigma-70 factor (ECF subfamily)
MSLLFQTEQRRHAEPEVERETPASETHARVRRDQVADIRDAFVKELAFVLKALGRLGVPDHDRLDVAQDVFLAVSRKLDSFDRTRPLRPWLFAFIRRVASDYRKSVVRQRHSLSVTLDDESWTEPSTEADEDDAHSRLLLHEALLLLPERQRWILVQHDIEGWPIAELAAVLHVPLQTMYSRVGVARRRLATALRRLAHARVHIE